MILRKCSQSLDFLTAHMRPNLKMWMLKSGCISYIYRGKKKHISKRCNARITLEMIGINCASIQGTVTVIQARQKRGAQEISGDHWFDQEGRFKLIKG